MSEPGLRILVIGFGNPGRRDDGLGPALADRIEALDLPGVTVERDYQLCIEHAELAASHDVVAFVDAAVDVDGGAPFYLRRVHPAPASSYSSHSLAPSAVLELASECFGKSPRGWVLGIRAADVTSFTEGLTEEAEANLAAAVGGLLDAVRSGLLGGD